MDVPRALISMPEVSSPVVNVSSDVRVVHEGQDQLAILTFNSSVGHSCRPMTLTLGNQRCLPGLWKSYSTALDVCIYPSVVWKSAMRANGAIGVSQTSEN